MNNEEKILALLIQMQTDMVEVKTDLTEVKADLTEVKADLLHVKARLDYDFGYPEFRHNQDYPEEKNIPKFQREPLKYKGLSTKTSG